jgi:cell division septum initiation protein DivIVA
METARTDAAMGSALPDPVPAPKFKTVKRGFDQNHVAEYIGRLNDRLRTVEHLVIQLRYENEQVKRERDAALRERAALVQLDQAAMPSAPSQDADTYEQVSGRVTELLVAFDKDVEKIRGETEAEAQQIVERARCEAYRVSREAEDARTSATLAAQQAREQAERTVADLESRRDAVLKELRQTCTNFRDVIGKLAALFEGQDAAEQGNGSAPEAEASVPAHDGQTCPTVVLPDVVPDTA